jgi:hypothetical protein
MSRELFDAGLAWVGHRRGGLALAAIAACARLCGHQRLVGGHRRHDEPGGAARDAPAGYDRGCRPG